MTNTRRGVIGGVLAAPLLTQPMSAFAQAAASGTARFLQTFDEPDVPGSMSGVNARLSLTPWKGGTALQIDLEGADHVYASARYKPSSPIDLSQGQVAGLILDMFNPGDESIQVSVNLSDVHGRVATRSALIPARGGGSYYYEVAGPDVSIDTGLRDTPQDWRIPATKMTWMWGERKLDRKTIAELTVVTTSMPRDRRLLIDNIRVISDPPRNEAYLSGIIDPFGQAVNRDFAEKVTSEVDLQQRAVTELDTLRNSFLPGRSKWQGWKDGPRLKATGYFRTEKVGRKWWLVDPDGYLFFATGIANIRLANTTTLTGYDFRPGTSPARENNDTTPSDSLAPKRASDVNLAGRFVTSELRSKMFTWLPRYDDPLGDHYSYVHELHSGPQKSGEAFSFYSANLERKYGDKGNASYLDDWRAVTKARMVDWGFTSYGNWLDPSFYADPKIPYFANGWIIGPFKTVSSGDDYWGRLPDPFDPVFADRARVTARQIATEVMGSPWCVGVFIDNEKSWGRPESIEQQFGIVINTMKRSDKDSPTKAVWSKILRSKFGAIEKLNVAWGTDIKSWGALQSGVTLTDHNMRKQADYAVLMDVYVSEYFKVVKASLKEVLPNHLYMGARFATWGMTPEVRKAAAKYVDVMSYNEYREVPHKASWQILAEVDKPSIIGEFHMGAVDAGTFHPGLVFSADQKDRARQYKQYMDAVIANDFWVGAHWFQYTDSPLTGRTYDGENYNVGFVTNADIPYQPLVDAAREINRSLYTKRIGATDGD